MTPDDAVKWFGSQNKMAKAFGVTPPAILRWRKQGRFPTLREYQLSEVMERWKTAQNGSQAVLRDAG